MVYTVELAKPRHSKAEGQRQQESQVRERRSRGPLSCGQFSGRLLNQAVCPPLVCLSVLVTSALKSNDHPVTVPPRAL